MHWWLSKPPLAVQTEALRRSEGRIGFNQWMSVGLGKTIVELNEWSEDYNNGTADFLVVVSLNSFKRAWLDEIDKFSAPEGSKGYHLWDKPVDAKTLMKGIGVIINWEALIAKGGEVLREVARKRKVRLCLDESHRIKNPQAQVSKFVVSYWKDAVKRRGLTGTPMSDNVVDMFVPFKLGQQIDGWNQLAFRNRYAVLGGFQGKQTVGIKKEMLPELHAIRDRAGFVATKQEWLKDLPEQRWVTPIRVPLHSNLESHYRAMARHFYTILGDAEISANLIVTQLLRLQQISSGFATSESGETVTLLPLAQNLKFRALLDLIESRQGSKLLVFTHYVWTTNEMYYALQQALGPYAVSVMRSKDHWEYPDETEQEKRRFNSDDACRIMVAQSTVASESHTLLGTDTCPCHGSVFFENNFVLRTRMQAEGRNHRQGQKLPVDYYDIVSSPIEEKVVRALQDKLNLVDAVMSLTKIPAT